MTDKPTLIAVISDTHVDHLEQLPREVLEVLPRADLIFHLGDFESPGMIDELKQTGKFCGVWGNHDRLPEMRRKLNRLEVREVDGKRIGLIHGLFYPPGRQRRMLHWFKKQNIDIMLFGHSHLITQKTIGGVYVFNPGTVTCKFPAIRGSFGLLTLNGAVSTQVIILGGKGTLTWKILTAFPAWFIREGTGFLESWPYLDLSPVWNFLRPLKRVISPSVMRSLFRQKSPAARLRLLKHFWGAYLRNLEISER